MEETHEFCQEFKLRLCTVLFYIVSVTITVSITVHFYGQLLWSREWYTLDDLLHLLCIYGWLNM